MKKITALLLALVMVFSMTVNAFAATVTPEVSAASVVKGQDVTVTLKLDETTTGITNFEYRLFFDDELFELKSSEKGNANTGTTITKTAKTDKTTGETYYGISLVDPNSEGLDVEAGVIYTLVFTALEDLTEDQTTAFNLVRKSVMGTEIGTQLEVGNVENGEVSITVTTAPLFEGYTVTMPADITVNGGETVSIPVVVSHTDSEVQTYNAFDMSFTYDAAALELTSAGISGMTVTAGNGTVRVQRYGDALSVGSTAFTLTFKALQTGESTITATTAKVDIDEEALQNAPEANFLDDKTVVNVSGYTVSLPDGFTGNGTVESGDDYTFEATDKNYNYTFSATMGDEPVDVIDNGDGTYTVEDVTGNLVIEEASRTGKYFDVTLGEDMTAEKSGKDAAQYMTNYVATLTKEAGYGYNVTVTINNVAYTGFVPKDNGDGTVTYTIPGADITGAIMINSGKTAGEFTVTFQGSGAGDASGAAAATGGQPYSFTLNKAAGYVYNVSAIMGDEPVELAEEDGTYTIANVTGNIVITIEKEDDLAVEVSEYVAMDGKTVFLVKATATLDEGKTALAYDGSTMYYSDVYKAWSWLVIVEEGTTFTAADAKAKIAEVAADAITLTQTYDVNGTDIVDINDAQLVFNMYNAKYDDFSVVNMEKFLNADVTGDGTVNVSDAAAVVSEIA